MFKIALDAGHGYDTSGKRCLKKIDPNQTREWWLNDRICDKIEQKLKSYNGYELLRVDDVTGKTDVGLQARCDKANKFGANIYISIHHNAGINGGSGGGISCYVWTGASDKLLEYQKTFYNALINATGLKGNRAEPLLKKDWYVLKHTKMKALLFENGFMDSTKDTPIILTDDFADKAATAYVETLVKIGGLTKNNDKTATLEKENATLKSENANLKNQIAELKAKISAAQKALQ